MLNNSKISDLHWFPKDTFTNIILRYINLFSILLCYDTLKYLVLLRSKKLSIILRWE